MEQGSQTTDSLYDFLYVDKERVSSLLTQLYAPGVVTSVKRVSSESEKTTNSGGFDLKLAKGNASIDEAISHTQERLFDASWALPINLLDKLTEADLIKTGISAERLGNTVLIKGRIGFFDISFFQKSLPFIGKTIMNDLPKNQKNRVKLEEIPISEDMTFGMVDDLFNVIPNTLQVDFVDDHKNNIWMTLAKEYLTINPDDMVLKYGGVIPGEWFVIGLVDALPDCEHQDNSGYQDFPEHPLKDGFKDMLKAIREMAGRSENSYGMTPLVVFRKII